MEKLTSHEVIKAVATMAAELMDEHIADSSWGLKITNLDNQCNDDEIKSGKRVMGQCHHGHKTISLNYNMIVQYPCFEMWRDVVLHEIAHQICGFGHKPHGLKWKYRAWRLGVCEPSRCTAPKFRYYMWEVDQHNEQRIKS